MHDTTLTSSTVDLFTHDLQFEPSGAVSAHERRMSAGDADRQLAVFHAETAADVHPQLWEKHPLGDEVVGCLRGAIRLHLRSAEPNAPDDVVRLPAGRAVIVPRDRWHRFEFEEPVDLLAVTLRQGTQLEARSTA